LYLSYYKFNNIYFVIESAPAIVANGIGVCRRAAFIYLIKLINLAQVKQFLLLIKLIPAACGIHRFIFTLLINIIY